MGLLCHSYWELHGIEVPQWGASFLPYPQPAIPLPFRLLPSRECGVWNSRTWNYKHCGTSSFISSGVGFNRPTGRLLFWAGRGELSKYVTLPTSWFPLSHDVIMFPAYLHAVGMEVKVVSMYHQITPQLTCLIFLYNTQEVEILL